MRNFSEEINNSLDLLFKLEKQPSKKTNLLDKGKLVYLQVSLFRIPGGSPKKRKFLKLRHSLYGDDPDICLFVPNRKTGLEYKITTDELIDLSVDHYTELLEKHKVKGITTVMPLKQLKSEYGTYDLKRKLVRRFDLFLCKKSMLFNSRFVTSLGKIFKVANKEPFGVSFPKEKVEFDPKFQKNIDKIIYSSSFFINKFSDHYSIPFGRITNTKTELKENLQEVVNQILTEDIIPGGFKNIRTMHIWPSQSKNIPFYFCPDFPTDLKKPKIQSSKSKKRPRKVVDEISSLPNKKVCVMPTGEVFVYDKKKSKKDVKEPEPETESEDDSIDEGSDEEESERTENGKKQNMKKGEDSDSENDEEIEEKEAKLMEEKMRENLQSESESESESNAEEETVVTKTKKKNVKGKANKAQKKLNMKKEKFKSKEKQKAKLKKKK